MEKQMRYYHETPYARLFLSFVVSYCSDSDSLQAERNIGFSTHMDCGSFVAEQRGRPELWQTQLGLAGPALHLN